jgi:hypothetical protein
MGVRPTVDEGSLSPEAAGGEEQAAELRGELDALADQLASPAALEDVSPDYYDGEFVPGGHGPMEDLAASEALGRLVLAMLDDDQIVAAVCHGSAGLLSATRPDGTSALAGRKVAGFTNEGGDPGRPCRQGAVAARRPDARGRGETAHPRPDAGSSTQTLPQQAHHSNQPSSRFCRPRTTVRFAKPGLLRGGAVVLRTRKTGAGNRQLRPGQGCRVGYGSRHAVAVLVEVVTGRAP